MLGDSNKVEVVEEEVDAEKKRFPLLACIVFGILIVVAIVCIVIIFNNGGPVNPSGSSVK